MDTTDIRNTYVTAIGETATASLETAGLLPTVAETQWRVDQGSRVTTETRDTVPYVKQQRYVTDWADLPEAPA